MTEESKKSSGTERLKEIEEDRLRQRLLAVEREALRGKTRLRALGLGVLVALILAAAAAFTPQLLAVGGNQVELGTLTVQEVVIVDAQGVARGRWAVDGNGDSRISFLDRQGRSRMILSVLPGGSPGLALLNANGTARIALGINEDEGTNLVFSDGSGLTRAVLGMSRTDAAQLVFADADAVGRVALGLDASGVGIVMLPEGGEPSSSGGGGS